MLRTPKAQIPRYSSVLRDLSKLTPSEPVPSTIHLSEFLEVHQVTLKINNFFQRTPHIQNIQYTVNIKILNQCTILLHIRSFPINGLFRHRENVYLNWQYFNDCTSLHFCI